MQDRRIIVITGMRRVGKTTALRWLLDQIPGQNKIYLDLERLDYRRVFEESNYEVVIDFLGNRGLDVSQPLTVAVDEIQYAPNLPSVVKYLYDQRPIKFLLTGSSSYYLKHYFSESMAGRKVVFEMFPLGFGEFLDFRGVSYRRRSTLAEMRFEPYEYERLKSSYDDYVTYGGLPDVVLEPRPAVRNEILNDIFSSYINIDVKAMADFRKIGELDRLLHLLAARLGNKLDITRLAQTVGIARQTVSEYLEFLEKTYLIHRLPAYAGTDRAAVLGKKLYFYDNGIAGILSNPGQGALFENAVFNQLCSYGRLSYLGRGSEYEVDFILSQSNAPKPAALEVKVHPTQSDHDRLQRIARRHELEPAWLIGYAPTPAFPDFIWGGLIY
jgi:predicted AAA+ superfamily ATPase